MMMMVRTEELVRKHLQKMGCKITHNKKETLPHNIISSAERIWNSRLLGCGVGVGAGVLWPKVASL